MSFHLTTTLLGQDRGNFRYLAQGDHSLLRRVRRHAGQRHLIIPRLAFTTAVLHVPSRNAYEAMLTVPNDEGDGVCVSGTGIAVGIPVADCLVTTIMSGDTFSVLHTGFRNLVPEDGGASIITQALQESCFENRDNVTAYISRGIGPCCYAADHWPEVQRDDPVIRPFIWNTTVGSPIGKPSLDLHALAKDQCVREGILEQNIRVDAFCTSCANRDGVYQYYSHARAKAAGTKEREGRNLLIAYLRRIDRE